MAAGALAMAAGAGGLAGCSTAFHGGPADAATDSTGNEARADVPQADGSHDLVPDATPDATPDVVPDTSPDLIADATTDAVGCSNPTEIGWTSEALAATPTALFSTANDVWMFVGGELRHFDGLAWTSTTFGPQVNPSPVWASSASDVWVGGDNLQHWDGTRWTLIPKPGTPPPSPANPIPVPFVCSEIRGSGPNDIWVRAGSIFHWDGVTWTERAPPPSSTLNIISMWAPGPGDAWLLGSVPGIGGAAAVGTFRWTEAGGWTQVGDAMDPVRQKRAFRAGTGAAPDDIWGFVDDFFGMKTEIWHFDGQAWTPTTLGPSQAEVVSAWTINRADIWATVGAVGDPFRRKRFWHFDGASWSAIDRPDLGDEKLVAGTRDDDLWAVSLDNRRNAFLEHRHAVCAAPDGGRPPAGTWIPQAPAASSIRAVGTNDLWGVFDFGESVRRWDGTAWTTMFDVAVDDPIASDSITSLWATSDSDVWAGGNGLFHWDGRTWTNLTPPVTGQGHMGAIWGLGPANTWVVFTALSQPTPWAPVFHWNGATWTELPNATAARTDGGTLSVVALWGTSATDLWGAGHLVGPIPISALSAAFLHWNGSAWTVASDSAPDPSFSGKGASAIWGASATSIFAVGDGGAHAAIWHYDGTAWRLSDNPASVVAQSVWGSSDHDVWATMGDGTLRHFDGASWTTNDPGADSVEEVTSSGPGDVWVRGVLYDVGALFHLAP